MKRTALPTATARSASRQHLSARRWMHYRALAIKPNKRSSNTLAIFRASWRRMMERSCAWLTGHSCGHFVSCVSEIAPPDFCLGTRALARVGCAATLVTREGVGNRAGHIACMRHESLGNRAAAFTFFQIKHQNPKVEHVPPLCGGAGGAKVFQVNWFYRLPKDRRLIDQNHFVGGDQNEIVTP